MKTKTAMICWFALATGLCAAPQVTFTNAWKDTGVYDATDQITYAKTTGSFSAKISLPLNGVDLSETDAGTQFSFAIGPAGSTTQIISGALGGAESFSPGKKSAKFAVTDPNSGDTNGSVTVSWTAATITVTGTATEDILGEEQIFSSDSDGSPTNTTLNTAITGVYYEVSLTLDASDNGGGTFYYDNPYVPVTGKDQETEYDPDTNNLSPIPLESGSVTGTGDFTPPTLKIISPKSGFMVYDANPLLELAGSADDSQGVTNIQCFVNGDTNNPIDIDQSNDLPTNKISWTAEVDLSQSGRVGSNVVTVIAQDLSGNQASASRVFLWIETNIAVVTVNPAIAGKVTGIKNGEMLYVGNGYAVTAVSTNKNWIFSDWTDSSSDVLSSNATFEYFDENGTLTNSSPPTLTANFVPNPFTNAALAGTYTGLYFDTNDETVVRDDGYITITVRNTGAFTGKIYNADYSKTTGAFSGQLSEAPDGTYATATPPLVLFGKHDYLQLNLQIATDPVLTDPGAGLMTGYVNSFDNKSATNATDSAEIMGELSFYNTNTLPGLYNIVIAPVSSDPSQGPGGYSCGTATVSKKGAVSVVLNLADGASKTISFSSALAQDGSCPIYAALYGGNAVLLGWMQFATDGSGSMSPAAVTWFTENYDPTLLPRGTAFSGQPLLSGGLYTPPKAGTNIFGDGETALTFEIDTGYANLSLPDQTDVPVTFNPAKNTFTDTNKVSITLTPKTGALTGAFHLAGGKTSFTYHGVVVDGAGCGFYTDTANKETGPIGIH